MNRDIVFARMSGNFLTEHLPDDWASWSDEKLQKFFSDYAWHPFEHWAFKDVFDLINIATYEVMKLLEESKNDGQS